MRNKKKRVLLIQLVFGVIMNLLFYFFYFFLFSIKMQFSKTLHLKNNSKQKRKYCAITYINHF